MREVVLDFETVSACDLPLVGADRYAEDPSTAILSLTYHLLLDQKRLWYPGLTDPFLEALVADPDVIFIAHHAGFEKAIWRHKMVPEFGFKNLVNSRWHDTMAVAAMKQVPQDLDMLLRVLGSPFQKDREGSTITKNLSKSNKKGYYPVQSPAVLRRVYDYNLSDLDGTEWTHKRLGWLPQAERQVWLLDQRINERGVRLDVDFIRAAQRVVEGAIGPLAKEFADLTGGIRFTQRDRFIEWITSQGGWVPDLKKETLAAILGETEDGDEMEEDSGTLTGVVNLPANVMRALAIRQQAGSASIKKLARMLACVSSDGRARGLLQYHGAGPGRWAGRLLQPQNFPRGTLQLDDEAPDPHLVINAIMTGDYEYVAAVFGDPIAVVVSSLRYALIPDPGRIFVSGDFATVEARVDLSLAGQHDKTAIMAAGKDIYIDMAEAIYSRTLTKKNNPEERQTGKNSVLGLGFQMGWRKFKLRYAKDKPDEFCQRVVKTYREEWAPLVPDLWDGLEHAALRAVIDRTATEAYGVEYLLDDGWLTARLPSGRRLWYYDPVLTTKAMPWDETDIKPLWTYKARKVGHWKTIDAFGGLLTENVVQGLARDLLVSAMFKCEANGFPIALTVHDEIVAEPLLADADPLALKQIMCDSPGWAKAIQIPVAAEVWKGDRYRK